MGSQGSSGLAVRETVGAPSSKGQLTCPRCGQTNPNTAARCRSCLQPFAKEGDANPEERLLQRLGDEVTDDLLDDLESAVAGERRVPKMVGKVSSDVPGKKKELLAFLQGIPGVSSLAAHSAYGFFQDLDQIGMADVADLAALPGVSREEAGRILSATASRRSKPDASACPTCGRPVTEEQTQCPCGTVFESTGDVVRYECPNCGAPVEESANRCACGATFS